MTHVEPTSEASREGSTGSPQKEPSSSGMNEKNPAVMLLKKAVDPERMAEIQYAFECIERHRFDGNPPKGTIDVWDEREEA